MSACDLLPFGGSACKAITGALGGAAHVAGDALLKPITDALASAAQHGIALVLGMWTRVPIPQFSNDTGPVGNLRHYTGWIVGALAVVCLIIGAARLAFAHGDGRPMQDIGRGFLILILTTALVVPVTNLLTSFADQFSTWIIGRAADTGQRLGAFGAGIAALEPGWLILLGLVAMLTSAIQIIMLIIRVAIIAILLGALPMLAATSFLPSGMLAFRRALGWLLAAICYGPVAAIIYATAIWLVNQGQDVVSILSGLGLMILAVLALPALMRLIAPLTSPAIMAGSGGAAAGAAAVGATGARLVSSSHNGTSANGAPAAASAPTGAAATPTGSSPAGSSAATSGAATGAANGASAGGGAAAGGAAAAAGGPVGVGVAVAVQGAGMAKKAASGAVPAGSNGNGHKEETT